MRILHKKRCTILCIIMISKKGVDIGDVFFYNPNIIKIVQQY